MFSITKDYSFTKQLTENLGKHSEFNKRHVAEPMHVSDLKSFSSIRKQYYHRKFPGQNVLSDHSVYNFILGESSEYIIAKLANLDVVRANRKKQQDRISSITLLLK